MFLRKHDLSEGGVDQLGAGGGSKTYYDLLGVEYGCSENDLRAAFRKTAAKNHPDLGGDPQAFKELSTAYETLSDRQARCEYDRRLALEGRGGPKVGMSWDDLIDSILSGEAHASTSHVDVETANWGRPRTKPQDGDDVTMSLEISFSEALTGCVRKVTYDDPETGEPRSMSVRVPVGAVDGGRLRFKGRGRPGMGGGANGDLLVETRVGAHRFYWRKGPDVGVDLKIGFADAALGGSWDVPLPTGGSVKTDVPPGSPDGTEIRFSGLGTANPAGGRFGDFVVRVRIDIPDLSSLPDADKDAIRRMTSSSS